MSDYGSMVWLDGQLVTRESASPSIASISFHMGTGVFDGIMAYWNGDHYYLHRAEEHLARFRGASQGVGLNFHWTAEELLDGIGQLLNVSTKTTRYIRPIAYRGGPELWLTGSEGRPVNVCIFSVGVARDTDLPLKCEWSAIERVSSRAMPVTWKVCGLYVNSFLARRSAESRGFHDGIMLDREGFVAEASAANIFFIRRDRLVTPRLRPDVFPGITRRTIIELALNAGIACEESDLRHRDLAAIEGAFLTSTLMEIRAIDTLGELTIKTLESPVFKAIVGKFRSVTHQ